MTILLTNMGSITGFASEIDNKPTEVIEVYQEDQLKSDIVKIEKDLAMKGTSVEESLDNAIKQLEQEMDNVDALQSQCEDMIRTTRELKEQYVNYKNNPYGLKSTASNPVLAAAVATVASYFSANNYMLAFELLIHARDIKK